MFQYYNTVFNAYYAFHLRYVTLVMYAGMLYNNNYLRFAQRSVWRWCTTHIRNFYVCWYTLCALIKLCKALDFKLFIFVVFSVYCLCAVVYHTYCDSAHMHKLYYTGKVIFYILTCTRLLLYFNVCNYLKKL